MGFKISFFEQAQHSYAVYDATCTRNTDNESFGLLIDDLPSPFGLMIVD